MKKNITITVIVLLVLAFSFFLYKISPEEKTIKADSFDLSSVKPKKDFNPVTEQDHVKGDFNAKNTFIVYEDFQCPACASINKDLNKVVSELKDTRLVFRHFPLFQIHKNATAAAFASEAAAAQGKFWEMKDILYENQTLWEGMNYPMDKFMDYAKEIGIKDLEKFKSDMENKVHKTKIEKDLIDALSLELEGTPTLIFNGTKLKNMGIDGIKRQVENLYK